MHGKGGRPVGFVPLLALGVNGIVGVGIFFVPADLAARAPGYGSVAVFGLTALALAPVAVAFALLGSRFDVDGGPVVFARAAFGAWPGFVVGWIAYVSAIASASAVMAGLAGSLFQGASPRVLATAATGLATLLAAVVALGIIVSARAWTVLTGLKLLPLVALVVLYVVVSAPGPATPVAPAAPMAAWAQAGLLAMFALQGFEIVPVIAGQAHAPARSVPLATVGSLAVSALLYVFLQAACVAAVPDLAASPAPLAAAGAALGGPWLGRLIAVGTSVSALGIAFGMMVTTPRYLSALAAGEPLAVDVHTMSSRGVPLRALALTWILIAVLVQTGTRGQLFVFSSVAVLMQYGVTAAALLVLALRGQRGLRPIHAAVAVPALAVALALGSGATMREVAWASAALALGLGLRWLARTRPEGERVS